MGKTHWIGEWFDFSDVQEGNIDPIKEKARDPAWLAEKVVLPAGGFVEKGKKAGTAAAVEEEVVTKKKKKSKKKSKSASAEDEDVELPVYLRLALEAVAS